MISCFCIVSFIKLNLRVEIKVNLSLKKKDLIHVQKKNLCFDIILKVIKTRSSPGLKHFQRTWICEFSWIFSTFTKTGHNQNTRHFLWTTFSKDYIFQFRTKKMNIINEFGIFQVIHIKHHILAYTDNSDFMDGICPKWMFSVKKKTRLNIIMEFNIFGFFYIPNLSFNRLF